MNPTVNRSVIAACAIEGLISLHYDIGSAASVSLRAVGVNDHYLIRTNSGEFVLRLYQREKFWVQSEGEHAFEAEWLDFLGGQNAPVARPIRKRDGAFIGSFNAPEGSRFFLLFESAPGKRTYPPSDDQCRVLGRAVAQIHNANGFRTTHSRVHYDYLFLVHDPIERITGFLEGRRADDLALLRNVGADLDHIITDLSRDYGIYGVIGGDFNGSNHHFDANGRLTLFDFDFCGYGWRAYDLAMFLWSMEHVGASAQESASFLEGYQTVRPMQDAERNTIKYFAAAVQIFIMGYHVSCVRWAGKSFLNDSYWDAGFGHLKILHERFLNP